MTDQTFDNPRSAMDETNEANKSLVAENKRLQTELAAAQRTVEVVSLQLKSANAKLESVSQYADNIENDVITPYRVSTALLNNGEEILTQTANVATLVVASLRSIIR